MSLGWSVMPSSRFKIMNYEFLTAIDYDDEFHVNLLFDHSIYQTMCTHMGERPIQYDNFRAGGLVHLSRGNITDYRGLVNYHNTQMCMNSTCQLRTLDISDLVLRN